MVTLRSLHDDEVLHPSIPSGPTFLRGLCSSHLFRTHVWYLCSIWSKYLYSYLNTRTYTHAHTTSPPTQMFTHILEENAIFLFVPFVTCRQMPNHSGRVYSWDRQTGVLLSRLQRAWWVLNYQKSSRNLARKKWNLKFNAVILKTKTVSNVLNTTTCRQLLWWRMHIGPRGTQYMPCCYQHPHEASSTP